MKNTPNQFRSLPAPRYHRRNAPGFSLMEVLLAVFILGIGLIMVATIFPVGADWTRQSTEDSVAQAIAQNAVATIQNYYGPGGVNRFQFDNLPSAASPTTAVDLQALPALTVIPIAERTYQYGNPSPFPAANPAACTYYWTALARVQPGQYTGASRRYDLYVLVFRKGAHEQTFTPDPAKPFPAASNDVEVAGVRDSTDPTNPAMSRFLEPTLLTAAYKPGTYSANATPLVKDEVPPVGYIGIGQTSGTVFRQTVDIANSTASPRPYLKGQTITTPPTENVIYALPADGTSSSPLIYVYQTSVSF
jgi:type II secretory pathway pseudopilin PulG